MRFAEPRWVGSGCAIILPRVANVHEYAEQVTSRLTPMYTMVFAGRFDDSVEPELPRLLLNSAHRNSQIQISQIALNLQVAFTQDWQIAPEKGQAYLEERLGILRDLAQVFPDARPKFVGVSFDIRIPSDDSDSDILSAICRQLKAPAPPADAYDVEFKTTSVVKQRFFSNIVVRNFRAHRNPGLLPDALPLRTAEAIERGVSITVDFNDRYSFNEVPGYHSSEGTTAEVLKGALAASREATRMFTASS